MRELISVDGQCLSTIWEIFFAIGLVCFFFFRGREQGWRSGESTRLPPMWPAGFKSRRRRHMWLSLLLVLSLAPRGFSPGTPVFSSAQKPTLPNSNSIWNALTRLNEFIWTLLCFVVKKSNLHGFFFCMSSRNWFKWFFVIALKII